MQKVSIVIPVYNQQSISDDCIETIRFNTTTDFEIIVIDNGSQPDFQTEYLTRLDYTVLRNNSNLGFPVAVNQGVRISSGDTIVLLNNDAIVTPGWLSLLITRLSQFAIVGPVTNYCAGVQCVSAPIYNNEDELNSVATDWQISHSGQTQEVNWVIGFCMAFRRSLYDLIGPFDESLWPCSGEELQFCLEARKRGYKIGIARDCYIHHSGSQTFKAMQDAGETDYADVCIRNNKHIESKYGEFWSKQIVEGEPK